MSRDRVQQTKGYTVLKTTAQLETVNSEYDAQYESVGTSCPKQGTCRVADSVW